MRLRIFNKSAVRNPQSAMKSRGAFPVAKCGTGESTRGQKMARVLGTPVRLRDQFSSGRSGRPDLAAERERIRQKPACRISRAGRFARAWPRRRPLVASGTPYGEPRQLSRKSARIAMTPRATRAKRVVFHGARVMVFRGVNASSVRLLSVLRVDSQRAPKSRSRVRLRHSSR